MLLKLQIAKKGNKISFNNKKVFKSDAYPPLQWLTLHVSTSRGRGWVCSEGVEYVHGVGIPGDEYVWRGGYETWG